ncbi:hypothetical protein B9Z65_4734 [Elsinoe australis]|uniref:Uncharacterized protein n=1 Tax=Elsinoe australis TaxID=40998 RepID=A0A2P8A5W6_9PEZI|nr:hypothetical protein B9Z65_4734 [Elsinoe australis]
MHAASCVLQQQEETLLKKSEQPRYGYKLRYEYFRMIYHRIFPGKLLPTWEDSADTDKEQERANKQRERVDKERVELERCRQDGADSTIKRLVSSKKDLTKKMAGADKTAASDADEIDVEADSRAAKAGKRVASEADKRVADADKRAVKAEKRLAKLEKDVQWLNDAMDISS